MFLLLKNAQAKNNSLLFVYRRFKTLHLLEIDDINIIKIIEATGLQLITLRTWKGMVTLFDR